MRVFSSFSGQTEAARRRSVSSTEASDSLLDVATVVDTGRSRPPLLNSGDISALSDC